MKILFIAPLPPPINGNTLATKVLLNELSKVHQIGTVNLNKTSLKSGFFSFGRLFQILGFFKKIAREKNKFDLIYFSISESFGGNLKDLVIYLICFKKIDKIVIHMLGGAGMKSILEKGNIQSKLNRFFISRIKGVLVEGQSQADTFSTVIPKERIYKVPNFAEDFLFIDEEEIKEKFSKRKPIRILYLSNLLYGKGYDELADAYIGLSPQLRERVELVYVGGFESDKSKKDFFEKIKGHTGIIYYGNFVRGEEKKKLYGSSHVFCLPTYYPYEGQPISILEAYATGCFVITTLHSGIPEVFADNVNGYAVVKKSVQSLITAIEKTVENSDGLLEFAIANRNLAYNKYRTSIYTNSIKKIIESD
ncbi:glycosyltransferase [Flavihumibacter sp. R14]|nr:glycosyltransferase [Flavihumibacter soli]